MSNVIAFPKPKPNPNLNHKPVLTGGKLCLSGFYSVEELKMMIKQIGGH